MAYTLGLDVRADVVRGAFVRTTFRRAEPVCFVEQPCGPARSRDDGALTPGWVAAVGELLARLPTPPSRVVMAMDAREVSLRLLELPRAAMRRAAQVVPYELESLIPFDLQDVVVDYQPAREQPDITTLLAAAAPRQSIVDKLTALRGGAGLELSELGVSPAVLDSLAAAVPELAAAPALMLDVDATQTHACVLQMGRCQVARSLAIGLDSWCQHGLQPLLVAIQQTLAAHRAAGGEAPQLLWWSGAAEVAPLAESVAEALQLVVRVVPSPWQTTNANIVGDWPRYALATSLALRSAARGKRLNLLRGELAPKRMVSQTRRYARRVAICSAIVVASVMFYSFVKWRSLSAEHAELEAQLKLASDRYFDLPISDPERAERLLDESSPKVGPLPDLDAFDVLDALSAEIPTRIKHDTRRLTVEIGTDGEEGNLELQGVVDGIADRDAITTNLEDHRCLHQIETGKTTPVPGSERLSYTLTAVVHCGKRSKTRASGARGKDS